MRVGVHKAQMAVEVGELPSCGSGADTRHGGGFHDGRGRGHGWYCLCESAAGDIEHIGGDVEACERCDGVVGSGGITSGNFAVVVVRGCSPAQGIPVVVFEVAAGTHGQFEDAAAGALGESATESGDAHPPLWEVELFVELIGVVPCEGRGSASRDGIIVVVTAAGGRLLEGGCDGADDVEAEESGDECGARERDP